MTTFNKIILGQVSLYLEHGCAEAESDLNPLIHRLRGMAALRAKQYPFTLEEAKKIQEIGQDEEFRGWMDKEVSFIIFGLHLTRLWVEDIPKKDRPLLGISDSKLKMGHRIYTVDLLKLKHRDKEKYEEIKEVISESLKIAEFFYSYMRSNLYKEKK